MRLQNRKLALAVFVAAVPGIGVASLGFVQVGVGLAIFGATVTACIAIGSVHRGVPASVVVEESIKALIFVLIKKNLGGGIARAVAKAAADPAKEDESRDFVQPDDCPRAVAARGRGFCIGAALGVALGIPTAWMSLANEPVDVRCLGTFACGILVPAIAGGTYVAAILMLLVPGRHRRRICLCGLFGILVGAGFCLIAFSQPTKDVGRKAATILAAIATICLCPGVLGDAVPVPRSEASQATRDRQPRCVEDDRRRPNRCPRSR